MRICAAPDADGGGAWYYLGWDVEAREALARRLGRPPEPLGPRLERAAAKLRQPFLDLVAALGKGRNDAAWWAGTLAWKSWSASDLFLLCAYLGVCRDLAAEDVLVVVEDPWLLREAGTVGPSLVPWKLRAAALGAARRLRWAGRVISSRLDLIPSKARPPYVEHSPNIGSAAEDAPVLLHSYLQERTLSGGRWNDLYLTGLEEELASRGVPVTRSVGPELRGEELFLARMPRVEPMLRHGGAAAFFSALFALPPAPPREMALDGMPIGLLLRREWWHDLSRAGRCDFLLFWAGARRLLRSRPWKALVLAWEGQPPERLLALAAREAGVRVVGSQHTTVSPNQLPFFLGRGEADWGPYPDVVITTGPRARRLLAEAGVPPKRLAAGGSRRFRAPSAILGPARSGDVLVALPVDPLRAAHLLAAVARAYPSGGEGFRIVVKPHPGNPRFSGDEHRPLDEALQDYAVLVFTSSLAGLEAAALGRPALRYRPDAFLDVDPSDVLSSDALPTAGDSELRAKLDGLLAAPAAPRRQRILDAYAELFEPLDPAAWDAAIRGPL